MNLQIVTETEDEARRPRRGLKMVPRQPFKSSPNLLKSKNSLFCFFWGGGR